MEMIEQIKEEIRSIKKRATENKQECVRLAGVNSYGAGVESGAVCAANELLEFIEELEEEAMQTEEV